MSYRFFVCHNCRREYMRKRNLYKCPGCKRHTVGPR